MSGLPCWEEGPDDAVPAGPPCTCGHEDCLPTGLVLCRLYYGHDGEHEWIRLGQ